VPITDIGSEEKQHLRDAAESWAEDQRPGTEYSYGFEVVDRPPEKWVLKEIDTSKRIINNHRRHITRLRKLLPGGTT
jgi:hypothetical protein